MRTLNPPDRRTPRLPDAPTAPSAQTSITGVMKMLCLLGMLLSTAAIPSTLIAQEEAVTAPDVVATVGWQNVCKVGKWTEIRLTLPTSALSTKPDQLTLGLTANDPQGHLATFRQTPNARLDGDKIHLSGIVKPGSLETPITIRLEAGEAVIWQKRLRPEVDFEILRQEVPLLVTFGDPKGFEFSDSTTAGRLTQVPRVVDLPSPDDFSLNPLNYEMLHSLVFADRYDVSKEVANAIREWTNRGGHLMIASGSKIDDFKASQLFSWIPAKFGELSRLRELNGFEAFVGRTVPIRVFDPVTSPRIEIEQGTVLFQEIDGPTAVRLPLGFGRVTFLALSINEAPVADWTPLQLAIIKLTDLPMLPSATGIASTSTNVGKLGQSGLSDLKTQLQMSIQSDLYSSDISVWTIILTGLLIALIVGPLDYAFCRYVIKSPSMTWLTLPVWIVTIGLIIIQWNHSRSAERSTVGKVNLINLNLASQTTRIRSWITWSSPVTKRYDMNQTPPTQTLAWSGEPENAFGGMYRTRTVQLNRADYTIDLDTATATGIPSLTGTVNSWECQSFSSLSDFARTAKIADDTPLIQADLTASALGQISGSLTHNLPADLKDWVLIYGPRVYFPRIEANSTLLKNQPITLDSTLMSQSELSAYLRRQSSRKVKVSGRVGDDIIIDEENYDPHSTDLMRIIRIITIYSQFRGREYTGMENSDLTGEDLSNLLELGHAILIAETDGITVGQTNLDGAPAKTKERSFVRMILPVNRVQFGLNQLPTRMDAVPSSIPRELPPEVPDNQPSNES